VAYLLAGTGTGSRVLTVGAQSSLTGGATPFGDLVLSTERLTDLEMQGERIRAGAGVTLQAVQERLAATGRWLPPVPTYLGATAGGAAATCAAGAATFKYGTVRDWIDGITVVLVNGDVLALERGQRGAASRVALPSLRMPDVPKCSAGYFIAPDMDLVDLFIGSEGTLGVITEVLFRTAALPAGRCRALVPMADEAAGIRQVADLRAAAQDTWRTRDPLGIDVAAIEHIDARSLHVIREDGVDRKLAVLTQTVAVSSLAIYDLAGKKEREVPLPGLGTAGSLGKGQDPPGSCECEATVCECSVCGARMVFTREGDTHYELFERSRPSRV